MDNRKFRQSPLPGDKPAAAPAALTVAEARAVVSRSILLLDEMIQAAHRTIIAVPAETMQAVFIEDKPPAIEPLANAQARPRGRAHPLIGLFRFGLSAGRLMKQLVSMLDELDDNSAEVAQTAAELNGLMGQITEMAKGMGLDPGTA